MSCWRKALELGAAFSSSRRSASTWPNILSFFTFASISVSEDMFSWADFTDHCLLWMLQQRLCSESDGNAFFRLRIDWMASLWVNLKYSKCRTHGTHGAWRVNALQVVVLQMQSHVVYRALLFGRNLRGKSKAMKSTLGYLPSQENELNLQPCKYLPVCMLRWTSGSGSSAEVYTPFLFPVGCGTIWGRHSFLKKTKRC